MGPESTRSGADRPTISAQLRREVVVEAGDRCAIPTCRQIPIEVHHIDGKPANNAFENLIALCANCHARVTKRDIPTAHVRMYKANLSRISTRYGDVERRVLNDFVDNPKGKRAVLPRELSILMNYLVQDGIVQRRYPPDAVRGIEANWPNHYYWLTEAGHAFVQRLREGRAIE
jgi:hypothetical protein